MAIFNSFLLGQVSKSVGNVTMCQLRGESVARGKIKFRRDNPTPEVLDMRAKIRELGGLGKRLVPVIRKGFVGVGGSTTSNAFVKMNLGAVDVTAEHVATVDFDRLKLASGVLIPPSMTVTVDALGSQFTVSAAAQEAMSGFAALEDLLWLVFIDTDLRQAVMLNVGTRENGGMATFSLPENWTAEQVKAYCFATSENGKEVSDSKLLTITPEE